jgi:tetratricopeptide (TPR) repeat protein
MIVTLKPKPAQRLVENKAYLAAIKQATNDNADSNQTNNQGPQIVADGQHVLAVARTNQQRSGGEYWVGLGYFWQQDYATALTHEQQSISYDSSNTTAIITSGDLLVNTDQNQAAIAMAERALSLDPKSSSAYRVMAFAESNLGSQAQALADITKATTLDQAAANQGYLASDTQDRNLIDSSNGGKVLFSPN